MNIKRRNQRRKALAQNWTIPWKRHVALMRLSYYAQQKNRRMRVEP